ncbi:MAG TPA: CDP-alcohol phosphatidyltransferase family protein [Candidatus Paceibacterota bacterium]
MSANSSTAMRCNSAPRGWIYSFFVNGVLTGARAYFAVFLLNTALYHIDWFLENYSWIVALGIFCGSLDLVDGRAAKYLGVESSFGRVLDPCCDGAYFLSIGFVVVALENFTHEAMIWRGVPAIYLGLYGIAVEIMRLNDMIERSSIIAKINVGTLGLSAISFAVGLEFDVETLNLATYWLHFSVCCATVAFCNYCKSYKDEREKAAKLKLVLA